MARKGKNLYGGYLDDSKCELLDQVAASKGIGTRTEFLAWVADLIQQSQIGKQPLDAEETEKARNALDWLGKRIENNPNLQTALIYYCRSLGWTNGDEDGDEDGDNS